MATAAMLRQAEIDLCWMEHDGAEPVDLALQRAKVADLRAQLQRAEIAGYLRMATAGMAMMQPGDYAAAAVSEREWPGGIGRG